MTSQHWPEHCLTAATFLSAVSNAARLSVLHHLVVREYSVNELANCVGLSQSALSQHLLKLRRQNLVRTRRDAQTIYYSCSSPSVKKLLAMLDDISGIQNGSFA
jgi:DNA-binding transcriptional ArsR family regulator